MSDIRVDDLDSIAEATFKSHLSDPRDPDWQGLPATWQNLSVNPRTCPRDDMPRLCTYTAWFARPSRCDSHSLFERGLAQCIYICQGLELKRSLYGWKKRFYACFLDALNEALWSSCLECTAADELAATKLFKLDRVLKGPMKRASRISSTCVEVQEF